MAWDGEIGDIARSRVMSDVSIVASLKQDAFEIDNCQREV